MGQQEPYRPACRHGRRPSTTGHNRCGAVEFSVVPEGDIPLLPDRILEGRSEPNSVWSGLRHKKANDVVPISHGRARCWLAHWPHDELTPWGLAKWYIREEVRNGNSE
jgi:hypothetical protein